MNIKQLLALGLATAALAACTTSDTGAMATPEGALIDTGGDIAYEVGELSEEQLASPARPLFIQDSMNVFRRFPRDATERMVDFYTEALALEPLSPIQLTQSQRMILTGVGSGQIKLSAGQLGDRQYNLRGGITGGTGIRYFRLTYPDARAVRDRFAAQDFDLPYFAEQGDGTRAALVTDPGGFPIQIVIEPGAQEGSDDGVGVGVGVSDLAESRRFYREFVGLDELPPVEDPLLGVTKYPYRHAETTIYLHEVPEGVPADTGSAGIQYVVSDAPLVAAKADYRDITVETPLNKLRGFDLITVWLNDPDGVTNYFAQVGPRSRTARQASERN